jgi:hypothetical protein
MTATLDYQWQGVGTRLPSGHRIFEAHGYHPDGMSWAIADTSGGTPEQTEDGVMWLDTTRALQISETFCTVPVIMADETTRAAVGVGGATILMLARQFGWAIQDEQRGAFYNEREPSKLDMSDGRRVALRGTARDFDRVQQACRHHLSRFEEQVRGGADPNSVFGIHVPERDRT